MCVDRRLLGAIVTTTVLIAFAGCQSRDPVPGRLFDGTVLRQLRSAVEAEKREALEDLRHIGWYYHAGGRFRPDGLMEPLVETLRAMIRNDQEPLRLEAMQVLASLALPANDGSQTRAVAEALPELTAIASNPRQDGQLRGHAIDVLRWLGDDGARPLAMLLFDQTASLQHRFLAARALKSSEFGRSQLRRAVDTQGLHALVRRTALEGVCERSSPECARLAGDADPTVRLTVAGAMAKTTDDPSHLAELRSALQDPSRRSQALPDIERLGVRGVPLLVEALDSPDQALRLTAVRSLGHLRAAAKGAIPALRQVEQEGTERLRQEAPPALKAKRLRREAYQAKLLGQEAAHALKEIGPPLGELVGRLAGPGPARDRAFAGLSLAARGMGEYAVEVIPALRGALKDLDPGARARAASALGSFKVSHRPASWKEVAATSPLGQFNTAMRDAIPDLIVALRDPEVYVRDSAALALQELLPSQDGGAERQAALQALAGAALEDPEASVRGVAVQVLGSLAAQWRLAAEDGDEAWLVMGALERASQDQSAEVRARAAQWLESARTASRR